MGQFASDTTLRSVLEIVPQLYVAASCSEERTFLICILLTRSTPSTFVSKELSPSSVCNQFIISV